MGEVLAGTQSLFLSSSIYAATLSSIQHFQFPAHGTALPPCTTYSGTSRPEHGKSRALTPRLAALTNTLRFFSFPNALVAEARPVIIQCGIEQDFKLKPEQLAAAITPKTRLFIINSPSNPTGSVYTLKELQALADATLRCYFKKHNE